MGNHGILILIDLRGRSLQIVLLVLVLFLQRTLDIVVTKFTTPEALYLRDVFLTSPLLLLPLGCKGCIFFLPLHCCNSTQILALLTTASIAPTLLCTTENSSSLLLLILGTLSKVMIQEVDSSRILPN